MMRITVLCAITLLACFSVNQAAPKSNWRDKQDNVRVVTWPPKYNERASKSPKVLSDPLRWVSAKDSQRYFQNTDGLSWVEMQPGKAPNMFTEVSRTGSDESLVVVLRRSDKLYVKLSEGMAWWSWNMGFPEKYQIGEGSWKKADSTRKAVEVIGPYRIISRGEPVNVGDDCEEDQDQVGPYKIISRGEPVTVGDDCEEDQDQVGPYKIISRGEPVLVGDDCEEDQDQVGPYKIISRGEPLNVGDDCDDDQDVGNGDVVGPYKIISRGEPVLVGDDCEEDQDQVGPYKIISRGEPVLVGDDCEEDQDQVGPYKIISRGEPVLVGEDCDDEDVDKNKEKKGRYAIPGRKSADSNTKAVATPFKWQDSKDSSHYFVKKDAQTWTEMQNGATYSLTFVRVLAGNQNNPMTFEVLLKRDQQSYVKLTNMFALWGPSETSTNTKFANGNWVTSKTSQKVNSKESKQIMNPQKLGSKDCRPSDDAKKNLLKFVLERDSKRVYRRTLRADDVCATTCNEQKLLWTGSWGAVEPKDVTVCECREPRISSRVSNFDRHSKEVDASECEAVFCESVVDLHNNMRVKHQVDKLQVDASLSTAASIYAKKLVSIGELRHSNLSDVGENLAYRMQTPPHRLTYKYCKKLGDQVTRMWYDEVEQYDFATGQAKTSNADVSHFTQLVWADSSKVGCGLAIDSTETRQKFFGVVRYSPPGNVGNNVENVKPASRLMSAVNWP